MLIRVILKHRNRAKIIFAILLGTLLASFVWLSDWWLQWPSAWGFVGPLYETHIVAEVLLIPGAVFLFSYFEQRLGRLLCIAVIIPMAYWACWLLYRFCFECQDRVPTRYASVAEFLWDYGLPDLWREIFMCAMVSCIAVRCGLRWWPRVVQDGTFCPKCAYSLRGLPHTRCPECGHEATAEDLSRP